MSIKIITTVAALALVALSAEMYLTISRDRTAASLLALDNQRQARTIASLEQATKSDNDDVARLTAEVARLTAANADLAAQLAAPLPPPPAPPGAVLGWMPRYEQQRLILDNLRQIDAARTKYELENKQRAESVQSLVGMDHYIKTVRPVDGEDYAQLSMESGTPLTVTTANGSKITYDPEGVMTTRIDYPPEVVQANEKAARAQNLAVKIAPAQQRALEAYRMANEGRDPTNPQALVSYFINTQERAAYVELLEDQKAAATAQRVAAPAQKSAPR